jgi:formate dehydrogenase subunit delta
VALDTPGATQVEMSAIVREAVLKHRDELTPVAA